MLLQYLSVDFHGRSDIGRVRALNEDHYLISSLHQVMKVEHTSLPKREQERLDSGSRALLLLVADGVSGGAAGETASHMALEQVLTYVTETVGCFHRFAQNLDDGLVSELAKAVERSHGAVLAESQRNPKREGMATTLTLVYVFWPKAYIVHVGDSKCFHLRDQVLTRLTKDQTVAQRLIDDGVLQPQDAVNTVFNHVLSSAVGSNNVEFRPAISMVKLERGDTLLLCTDGLTAHVSDPEIATILHNTPTAREACDRLIRAANAGGGSDNITTVVSSFQ